MLYIPAGQPQPLTVRNRIYRSIYGTAGFCSKQSVAANCEISMPTLYQNLSGLMDEGLVCYSGEELSTGGRKAQGLAIAAGARFAVGVSVTEHHLCMTAVDLRLEELAYLQLPLNPSDAAATIPVFCEILERFLDDNRLDRARLLGVGVALPGIISPDSAGVIYAPTLHLRNYSMREQLERIPYRVFIENDASSSGHAEWFIRGQPENMVYLSLENGVGGAVILGCAPYLGSNRRSGEFGHICVEPGGLQCSCGKRGCLEAYCSARRFSAELGITLDTFFAGLERHEPVYENLWYNALRHLAAGINDIRLMLDCDIVLGGQLTEYLAPYLDELKRYVRVGNPFEDRADFVQLSRLRVHIAPRGAALYYIREFIETI